MSSGNKSSNISNFPTQQCSIFIAVYHFEIHIVDLKKQNASQYNDFNPIKLNVFFQSLLQYNIFPLTGNYNLFYCYLVTKIK